MSAAPHTRNWTRAIDHDQQQAMMKELRQAHALFTESCPRRDINCGFRWQTTHHECSSTCPFFTYKHTMICRHTGAWHYCTDAMCDRKVPARDLQYCELSGDTFELDFQFEQGGAIGSETIRDTPTADDYGDITEPKRVTTQEQPQPRGGKPTATEAALKRIERAEKAQQPPTPKVKLASVSETSSREVAFESTIKAIFGNAFHTHFTLFREITVNSERMWHMLQASPYFVANASRYTEELHILVIMDLMKTGFMPSRVCVVPANEWIRGHMPMAKQLETSTRIKVGRVTAMTKVMQDSFIDMVTSTSADQRCRLQWIT
jgi:hypothetical protein